MFDKKSDYALNRLNPDAIVYKGADGIYIQLTRADFDSEEEFLRWKSWSDGSYHEIEKADLAYSEHSYSLSERLAYRQTPEDMLIEFQEQTERQELRRLLMEGFDTCLTSVQRRRLWMYCVDGLTVRQIAEVEGASFQSVAKAVTAAKKKIKKFLER